MWTTIADIALLHLAAFALWNVAGVASAIRSSASRIIRRKVTSVAVLDNSAAVAFTAAIITAAAQGHLCPLTLALSAVLAAADRVALNCTKRKQIDTKR